VFVQSACLFRWHRGTVFAFSIGMQKLLVFSIALSLLVLWALG
jgi:hypothetical protein